MRTCEVCLKKRPKSHYIYAPQNHDRLHKWCDKCRIEYFKDYLDKKSNLPKKESEVKVSRKRFQTTYYERHKDERREYQKSYRSNNLEEVREKDRERNRLRRVKVEKPVRQKTIPVRQKTIPIRQNEIVEESEKETPTAPVIWVVNHEVNFD